MTLYTSAVTWESPKAVDELLPTLETVLRQCHRGRVITRSDGEFIAKIGSALLSRFFGLSVQRGRNSFPMQVSVRTQVLGSQTEVHVSFLGGLPIWFGLGLRIGEQVFDERVRSITELMRCST